MLSNKDQYPQIPGPRYPSNPIFKQLELLKVYDIYKFQVTKFVFDYLKKNVPSNFNNWFNLVQNIHSHNTRSNVTINTVANSQTMSVTYSNLLQTKYVNLANYGAKMLKHCGPLLWNSLPEDIRMSESIYSFRKNLKLFLIGKYDSPDPPPGGYYYITKLSIDCMKITFSKSNNFEIPP